MKTTKNSRAIWLAALALAVAVTLTAPLAIMARYNASASGSGPVSIAKWAPAVKIENPVTSDVTFEIGDSDSFSQAGAVTVTNNGEVWLKATPYLKNTDDGTLLPFASFDCGGDSYCELAPSGDTATFDMTITYDGGLMSSIVYPSAEIWVDCEQID